MQILPSLILEVKFWKVNLSFYNYEHDEWSEAEADTQYEEHGMWLHLHLIANNILF
jgi:hypothetical protein